ncbi:unnamed protein product [Haemonchus placei]|uniref:TIL domain-containing protein n=1 Tax=Haemonchus placei TaxID=6290 RepID=A0A0N4X074_HAEPC|nr:unnamed protein product [Haemonchus placei]
MVLTQELSAKSSGLMRVKERMVAAAADFQGLRMMVENDQAGFSQYELGIEGVGYLTIPPGEDGESCLVRNLCWYGTVCVQTVTGARCMAKDSENNCDQKKCPSGSACEYTEPECIQDKPCYAEPKCKNQGPQVVPQEQTAEMVPNEVLIPSNQRSNPPVPACGRNEELNGCGALCEGKCENVNRGPIPCPLICLPPACACRDGFYRNANNDCVTASQCPRQCSANETFNSCGNLCEGKCENVGRVRRLFLAINKTQRKSAIDHGWVK